MPPGPAGGVTGAGVTPIAGLLALSDERDTWLKRVKAAWREGYQVGRESMADAMTTAYIDGLLRRKDIEHDQVRALTSGADRVDLWMHQQRVMWAPPGLRRAPSTGTDAREHFADPRPGDDPGRGRAEGAA